MNLRVLHTGTSLVKVEKKNRHRSTYYKIEGKMHRSFLSKYDHLKIL